MTRPGRRCDSIARRNSYDSAGRVVSGYVYAVARCLYGASLGICQCNP
jgi:hypothetical protein